MWTTAIALFFFLSVKYSSDFSFLLPIFYLCCWGFPFLFCCVVIIFGFDSLGRDDDEAEPWCWLTRDAVGWRMTSIYIPLLCTWIATALFYLWARRILLNWQLDSTDIQVIATRNRADNKLLLIPFLFLISRIWGAVYRTLSIWLLPEEIPLWLEVATAIGDPSQGFANCLIFVVFNSRIMKLYFACWKERKNSSLPLIDAPVEVRDDQRIAPVEQSPDVPGRHHFLPPELAEEQQQLQTKNESLEQLSDSELLGIDSISAAPLTSSAFASSYQNR